jgi:hypothetical protein
MESIRQDPRSIRDPADRDFLLEAEAMIAGPADLPEDLFAPDPLGRSP